MALSGYAGAQASSPFLNSSRAQDWSGIGWTIPSYTVPCSTQPSLTAGSGNAAANTTSIQSSINSCDATHNVVNLPAGTYFINGYAAFNVSNLVVRGAGPNSTYIYSLAGVSCNLSSGGANLCVDRTGTQYQGSGNIQPGGSNYCAWTGGYAQGSTTLTFNSCGSAVTTGQIIMLDQANDSGSDTGGIFICDSFTTALNCTGKNEAASNASGRVVGGVDYSEQQAVVATSVSGSGSGPYTVTIAAPGVKFNNIRSGQSPGAWFMPMSKLIGFENFTVDYTNDTVTGVGISFDACYHCWMRNIRSINAAKDHAQDISSVGTVYRDSYFYQSQQHGSESYTISPLESSDGLIENNIFQQVTNPVVFNQGSGYVVGYNFSIDNPSVNFMQPSYSSHNAGSGMNVWEGNSFNGISCDDVWGSSTTTTYFRNLALGYQPAGNSGSGGPGFTQQTIPIQINSFCRAFNLVGNVFGQPSYHTQYETYATSHTAVTGAGSVNQSILELGTTDTGGLGNCGSAPTFSGVIANNDGCDPLVVSMLMLWGNYDVANNAVRWNSTEASPGSVAYINANFSASYFNTLSQTLPNSLYLSGQPSWWRSMPFPPIGPDVTSGNLGICSGGTYATAMATASGQCTGGSKISGWVGHANAIPAQDCYLNVMNGPPDGTGGVLSYDASACYSGTSPVATPTFSPGAGTYGSAQSVTISTSTGGATICYTTDGSTPTANGAGTCTHGTTYSSAVTVSVSETLMAIGSESGFSDSSAGSAAYVISGSSTDMSIKNGINLGNGIVVH